MDDVEWNMIWVVWLRIYVDYVVYCKNSYFEGGNIVARYLGCVLNLRFYIRYTYSISIRFT